MKQAKFSFLICVFALTTAACSAKSPAKTSGGNDDTEVDAALSGVAGTSGKAGSGGGGQNPSGGTTGTGGSSAGSSGAAGMGGGGTVGSPDARSADAASVVGAPDAADLGKRDAAAAGDTATNLPKFSFFYTSLKAMQKLSGSPMGFGGDLRYGTPTGLEGADKICQTIAADAGAGGKTWRAFLSVVKGPGGMPGHAIDRIGEGPWYDRNGKLVAMNKAGLLSERPMGDANTVKDLPDESGQGTMALGDTHDVITASNTMGKLRAMDISTTCQDWTSVGATTGVGVGHAWPANSGRHWIQAHTESSCAAGVNLVQTGPGDGKSIGSGGGWGGFYCFATTP